MFQIKELSTDNEIRQNGETTYVRQFSKCITLNSPNCSQYVANKLVWRKFCCFSIVYLSLNFRKIHILVDGCDMVYRSGHFIYTVEMRNIFIFFGRTKKYI